jgi:HEAT repeat protein
METWIWIFRFLCVTLSLAAAFLLYRALFHDRSRGRRRCPRCWYDVAGVQGLTCPECGRAARAERSFFRTRRHWRRAAAALLVAVCAYGAGLAPRAIRSGSWWSAVPTPVLAVVLQFYDNDDAQLFSSMCARLTGSGAQLSGWERLLLARRCGKILLEPTITPPVTFSAPPPLTPFGNWRSVYSGPYDAPPSPTESGPPEGDAEQSLREAMQVEARDLLAAADAAFEAGRLNSALDKYGDLRRNFQNYLTPDEVDHVETQYIEIRQILGPGSVRPQRSSARTFPNFGAAALANGSLQAQALDALRRLGADARAAVPSLITCIDDRSSPYRLVAMEIVAGIGPQARSAVPAITRQLNDPDALNTALHSLDKLGPAAAAASPELRKLLRADLNDTRTMTIVHILQSTILESDLIDDLRRVLASDPKTAPAAAVRALELIGQPAAVAIPDLAAAARRRPELLSTPVIQVLAKFGPVSVPTLTDFVETGDANQQFLAACWLGTLRHHAAPATAALTRVLASPDQTVRGHAAHALGHIGAQSARPQLERLTNSDPIPWVRQTAAEAIARLDAPASKPNPR